MGCWRNRIWVHTTSLEIHNLKDLWSWKGPPDAHSAILPLSIFSRSTRRATEQIEKLWIIVYRISINFLIQLKIIQISVHISSLIIKHKKNEKNMKMLSTMKCWLLLREDYGNALKGMTIFLKFYKKPLNFKYFLFEAHQKRV